MSPGTLAGAPTRLGPSDVNGHILVRQAAPRVHNEARQVEGSNTRRRQGPGPGGWTRRAWTRTCCFAVLSDK